ncbi:37 kDa salivary gland allergen Aed a 2-like [Culex pipiens pallens]|uniref:37 kDa salivary gland allergen Aed a 2-like n=1 Tax=Culex pipiens pallens TaxID=42434 RepID=UPI001954901A|nr:37 kDa salivary gland allergen Aed a 2-like [Culex pipiens pallens]
MKVLILLGAVIAGVLSDDWSPMDPEEVAFEQAKCMEDHFGNDFGLAEKWMKWNLAESDGKTACYVKCLVEALGMYDKQAFQPNNIKQQYEAYKSDNGVDQAKSDAIANELGKIDAKDGKCESIAKGFIQVNNANKGVLEKIYLLDSSVRDAIYKKNPQIKPKGISIFRFCGKQFYQDGEAAYCNVRKHGFSDDPKFIKHSNCTTRGMRWMKKNGEMDESAIIRGLHDVNENGKDDVVKNSLKNCNAKDESKARDYYKCIYDGLGEQLFMKVLDYIEVRSENYSYRLREATSKYDANAMRSKVQALDSEAKC